jgi:hypothetical protein
MFRKREILHCYYKLSGYHNNEIVNAVDQELASSLSFSVHNICSVSTHNQRVSH